MKFHDFPQYLGSIHKQFDNGRSSSSNHDPGFVHGVGGLCNEAPGLVRGLGTGSHGYVGRGPVPQQWKRLDGGRFQRRVEMVEAAGEGGGEEG